MKKHLFSWIAGLTFAVSAGLSQAAPILEVDGSGILTGARNVEVNGVLYDVEFLDGTCVALFNGCNNAGNDFAFTTSDAAEAATQALLDHVLLNVVEGPFDTNAALTRGCADVPATFPRCFIHTPWALDGPSPFDVRTWSAVNTNSADALVDFISVIPQESTSNDDQRTWALWSAAEVPAPSTALCVILGAALAGTVSRLRKRERFLQDRA